MPDFIPPRPWPFGPKRPVIYLCKCRSCDFTQAYELDGGETIVLGEGDAPELLHVDKLPDACPKCGGRLSRKKAPLPILY